jgi:hypothetical protein
MFVFIFAVFVFSWFEHTVPDSLIYSFFGTITGEFGILGWIRVRKVKAEECNNGTETNE